MPSTEDAKKKTRAILAGLMKLPENRECADCGTKQPTWASTNLGVFVCIRCSGVHRNMGTHISKVKSATLDIWKMDLVKHFKAQGGNKKVNSVYEAKLDKLNKPTPTTDMHVLQRFIEDKYKRRRFYGKPGKKKKKKKDSGDESGSSSDEDDDGSSGSESSSSSSHQIKKKNKKRSKDKKPKPKKSKAVPKKIKKKERKKKPSDVEDSDPEETKISSRSKKKDEGVADLLTQEMLDFGLGGPEKEEEKTADNFDPMGDLFGDFTSNKSQAAAPAAINTSIIGGHQSPQSGAQSPQNKESIMDLFKPKPKPQVNNAVFTNLGGFSQPTMAAPSYGQPMATPNYGQQMSTPSFGQPVANTNFGQQMNAPNYGRPMGMGGYGGNQGYSQPMGNASMGLNSQMMGNQQMMNQGGNMFGAQPQRPTMFNTNQQNSGGNMFTSFGPSASSGPFPSGNFSSGGGFGANPMPSNSNKPGPNLFAGLDPVNRKNAGHR